MARFVRQAIFGILLAFFVMSATSEAQQFIGPRLYEENEKPAYSPISSKTAIALKDENFPYFSASGDDEAKSRDELLDFIENMNADIKLLAKEFDRDGIVVVRAVKTINIVDPTVDAGANDRDNTARSAKAEKKLSPSSNSVSSAIGAPFKRTMQDKCDRKELISQSSDAAD